MTKENKIDEAIKIEAELNEKADELGIVNESINLQILSGRITENELKLVIFTNGVLYHGILTPIDSTLTDLMIKEGLV